MQRSYIAIDLKSFYASYECVVRGLDPLCTNLVVADKERTDKTICLAVSPALKSFGIPGRPRLFEVKQKVKEENAKRFKKAHRFIGKSFDLNTLNKAADVAITFIIAKPQMAKYIEISNQIYAIYLRYVASEDIHVYSIDEVFIDVTDYLHTYKTDAKTLAKTLIRTVLKETGITATAGIGTNLYLAKVAMDIVAKHIKADKDGVRIASLDERSYREKLWDHRPLTDFWRVGQGYAKRLESLGLYTMGDIARCSIGNKHDFYNEDLLYKTFGVNAELLIDHAWGYEPCTIKDIKAYKPQAKSIGSGQVLKEPYDFKSALIVLKEMGDSLALDLTDKGLVTSKLVMTIGYDTSSVNEDYKGEIKFDRYGRKIPKHAHGTIDLPLKTCASSFIVNGLVKLYERIVAKELFIRRIDIAAVNVISEIEAKKERKNEEIDLFCDSDELEKARKRRDDLIKTETAIQKTIISLKKRYGKNAVIKGADLQDEATAIERNKQIGGHRS